MIDHFGFDADMLEQITLNALRASCMLSARKHAMEQEFLFAFAFLRSEYDLD